MSEATTDRAKPLIEQLPVVLTADERRMYGIELAEKETAYEREEVEQKEAKKAMKDALDAQRAEVMRLARIVETGREYRPVECQWRPDFKRSIVELLRLDTLEVVRAEPMTTSHLQRGIFEDEATGISITLVEDGDEAKLS